VELRLKVGGRIRSCERCAHKTPKSASLTVYPNPTEQGKSLKVTFAHPEESVNIENIEVFTLSGQRITSQTINSKSFEVETTSLPAGIYILKITTSEKEIYNEKVVVY